MDRFDPDDRPSIFSRPDFDDVPPPRRPPDEAVHRPPLMPSPSPASGPSRRLIAFVAGAGLLLLLGGGLVVANLLNPNDDIRAGAVTPSPSPSTTSTPSPSAEPSASETPTSVASPTPEPTPEGPPQEVAVGAWATVSVDELNVRSGPGTDARSEAILVRGAIAVVAEGPVSTANLNWYRIASLGGTVGWVTSGWVVEPFLTNIVEDPTLIRCGDVVRPVFDIVGGGPVARDPLLIGDFALPAAKFSDLALGTIELMRGVGQEVCFSAQTGSDGLPVVSINLGVGACGHAERDGSFYRLRPSAEQAASPEWSIKDPIVVHPALVVSEPAGHRMSTNIDTAIAMMGAGNDASGCLRFNVSEGFNGSETLRTVDATVCAIVTEYNADNLRLRPVAGGDTFWFKMSSSNYQPGLFTLNVPMVVSVGVAATVQGPQAWAHPAFDPECG